jgi:hypothetical protein
MFEQGQQYIFGQKLISDLGEEAVDDLIKLSRTTIKTTEEEYKVLIDYYNLKLKELTM